MGKKKVKNNQKIIIGIITSLIILTLVVFGANENTINAFCDIAGIDRIMENNNANENISQLNQEKIDFVAEDDLKVYFIDVGQADSILIMNKGASMLIDAGNNEDGNNVVDFIKEKGISKLNYVIGTHPHEDHIGGLDNVINNIEVENIYMPKIETNTKTFEDILDAISNKGMKVNSPEKGTTFQLGDAKCETMTDLIFDKKNLNLSSIVVRLTFGNNSFLFMGDAEKDNEKDVIWPKTDVLKVGHHGSNTSTSDSFVKQVLPKYSIIMVGQDNTYGLPKDSILEKLQDIGSSIYRTDEKGTIEVISNGNNIQINTQK